MSVLSSRLTATFFAFTCAAVAPASLAAPETVRRELLDELTSLRRSGFENLDANFSGSLRPGDSAARRLLLRAGTIYAFVVDGSETAEDIDITLHGPFGELVAGDNEVDRRASVVVLVDRTGYYQVTVTMWKAHTNDARFALLVAH